MDSLEEDLLPEGEDDLFSDYEDTSEPEPAEAPNGSVETPETVAEEVEEPAEGTTEDAPEADTESGPVAEGEEGEGEAEAVEAPAAEDAAQPTPPSEDEEETYKVRFANLRKRREEDHQRSLEEARQAWNERNQALNELEQLRRSVAEYLAAEQQKAPAPAQPQQVPEPTDQELLNAGFESRDQYRSFMRFAEQRFQPTVEQLQAQVAQNEQALQAERQRWEQQSTQAQQQQAMQAQREAVQRTVQAFEAEHPEYAGGTEESRALSEDLVNVAGRWNESWSRYNVGEFDWTDAASLEVAHEAVNWPTFASVLETNPFLFESQEGLELARHQARILDGSVGTGPRPKAAVDAAAVDQKLKAAQTEPAGSGPAKRAAPRDEALELLDGAIEEWNQDNASVF